MHQEVSPWCSKISQTLSIPSVDFSPSEGQSLHLLPINVLLLLSGRSLPRVHLSCLQSGPPQQSPGDRSKALQVGADFQSPCTLPGARILPLPMPPWHLYFCTSHFLLLENGHQQHGMERALRSHSGQHYTINRILVKRMEPCNLNHFKNSDRRIQSKTGMLL